MTGIAANAPADCALCPRLVALRHDLQSEEPSWHNAPVASFGPQDARLLIVGLAPGRTGANRTGRPFTGDFAGDLLYGTMLKYGFATGTYDSRPDDSLELCGAMITNAVRCLPPQNKPVGAEIANCRPFLRAQIDALPEIRAVLALGRIAHESVLRTFDIKLRDASFGHGAQHALAPGLTLFDSYHCSRYNTNTRRLTPEMFEAVFRDAKALLDS